MSSAESVWLSLILGVLFTALAWLRVRFPRASNRSRTAVLVAAAIALVGACRYFEATDARAAETGFVWLSR